MCAIAVYSSGASMKLFVPGIPEDFFAASCFLTQEEKESVDTIYLTLSHVDEIKLLIGRIFPNLRETHILTDIVQPVKNLDEVAALLTPVKRKELRGVMDLRPERLLNENRVYHYPAEILGVETYSLLDLPFPYIGIHTGDMDQTNKISQFLIDHKMHGVALNCKFPESSWVIDYACDMFTAFQIIKSAVGFRGQHSLYSVVAAKINRPENLKITCNADFQFPEFYYAPHTKFSFLS